MCLSWRGFIGPLRLLCQISCAFCILHRSGPLRPISIALFDGAGRASGGPAASMHYPVLLISNCLCPEPSRAMSSNSFCRDTWYNAVHSGPSGFGWHGIELHASLEEGGGGVLRAWEGAASLDCWPGARPSPRPPCLFIHFKRYNCNMRRSRAGTTSWLGPLAG